MPDENDTILHPQQAVAPPAACSAFVVMRLTDLKVARCAYKDELQDAIRALRTRDIGYVAFRWHPEAETYVQLEAHE